jgi:hypothetical protein
MVFAYLLPEGAHPPLIFFQNVRVCQVTPRLKGHFASNTTYYLFPEYFQSLRAKKIKTNFILSLILIFLIGYGVKIGKNHLDKIFIG